jgi:hypothetical protein
MTTASRRADSQLTQARLGARLAGALSAQVEDLPHDLSERLRVAREQAVARARAVHVAQPARGAVLAGQLRNPIAGGAEHLHPRDVVRLEPELADRRRTGFDGGNRRNRVVVP